LLGSSGSPPEAAEASLGPSDLGRVCSGSGGSVPL